MPYLLKKIEDLQLQLIKYSFTFFWMQSKNRGFWNIIQQQMVEIDIWTWYDSFAHVIWEWNQSILEGN